MPPSDWLPPSRVFELKRALGVDLRVVEAGARRRSERVAKFTAVGNSASSVAVAAAIPSSADMSNKIDAQPPTNLPPVGRHTQTLESKNQFGSAVEARVRKPSLSEVPELKKPKLEAKDVVMHAANAVEPGAPIDSQTPRKKKQTFRALPTSQPGRYRFLTLTSPPKMTRGQTLHRKMKMEPMMTMSPFSCMMARVMN